MKITKQLLLVGALLVCFTANNSAPMGVKEVVLRGAAGVSGLALTVPCAVWTAYTLICLGVLWDPQGLYKANYTKSEWAKAIAGNAIPAAGAGYGSYRGLKYAILGR